jgi:hypothetical protein
LLGAFVGAIYGTQIFKNNLKTVISERLKSDYDVEISEWVNTLLQMQNLGKKTKLVKYN